MKMKASEWAEGRECELHEIPFCADCRDASGIVRLDSGIQYRDDCAVQSYVEITGEDYEGSIELFRSLGYVPGRGTPAKAITEALTRVGFGTERRGLGQVADRKVRAEGFTTGDAIDASRRGRVFLLIGSDRRGAHAWTIIDGKVNRHYLRAPYRYGILEIVA